MVKHKIVAMGMAAAILTGCGASGGGDDRSYDDRRPSTETENVSQTTEPRSDMDRYLDLVYEETWLIEDWGEPDVREWGRLTCEVLDEGSTVVDIAMMLAEESYGNEDKAEEAATASGHAIRELCPEHAWQLDVVNG